VSAGHRGYWPALARNFCICRNIYRANRDYHKQRRRRNPGITVFRVQGGIISVNRGCYQRSHRGRQRERGRAGRHRAARSPAREKRETEGCGGDEKEASQRSSSSDNRWRNVRRARQISLRQVVIILEAGETARTRSEASAV